jgi:ADP-ribose pyrophosphatase YjhB (NUDIX family)
MKPGNAIKFCPQCGNATESRLQYGKIQPTCPSCGYIHFEDPKVAVAVLVIDNDKVLLTKRIYPPSEGCWTLPAGFMDAYEDPMQAAMRECREETGLDIRITCLVDVIGGREHPRGADVLIAYGGEVTGGSLVAGDDASEAAFFSLDHLPELAFTSTVKLLQKIVLDSRNS